MVAGSAVELYRGVGEGGELSGLDARLLEIVSKAGGRISAEELAKQLNVSSVTPARAMQRVREILKSQDLLGINDQKALLILDLVRLRDTLWDRVEGTETHLDKHGNFIDTESDPRHYANMIRLLKEWRSLIESMQTDVSATDVMIRRAHADMMMQALNVMFKSFIQGLERAGVKVSAALAMELMEEAMPLGFQELEKRIA